MIPGEYAALLKKGIGGGFLFCGEEEYLIARYLEMTRKSLFDDPTLSTFNHIRLHAEAVSADAILAAMESLPVFAERKLIEISGVNLSAMSEAMLEELTEALALLPQYEYNTLILTAAPHELDVGTPKKPSALLTRLSAVLTPVLFERQTPARLNKWLAQHFAAWGVLAEPQTCTFLMEYAGTDMYALSAQAEKCACYLLAAGRDRLTTEDILAVASPVTEFDTFALGDALLSRDTDRALAVLNDRLTRKERPELILGGIAGVYQLLLRIKIMQNDGMTLKDIIAKTGRNAYLVERYAKAIAGRSEDELLRALSFCAETDRKLKTTSLSPQILLSRLIALLR